MKETVIKFENVCYSYEGDNEGEFIPVLKDFSLEIARGDFVCVLGHNGSGKSTLARLMNGLFRPDEGGGRVTVCGMDTADDDRELDVRRTVGLVFQNPDNQLVTTVVEEDVAFGPENLGLKREEIRQRVDEALKTVDMYEYRDHATYKLSGGQKQRIAIAGILAMRPEILVLDEPTAMLDPKGRAEVLDTVRKLNKEQGMTVILITHHMEEAAKADRVIVMNSGRITADGDPRQVFAQTEAIEEAGLTLPEAARFAEILRQSGVTLPQGILSPEEAVDAIAAILEGN